MRLQQRLHWLILAVAVTIWIGVGVFAMALMPSRPDALASALVWILLFAAFGAALFGSVQIGLRSRTSQVLLIGVETLLVLAMAATNRGDPGPLLTPIALQVALLFGTRPALLWVMVQSILVRLVLGSFNSDSVLWFYWGVNIAGELIAVGAVHALRFEAERSLALGRINSAIALAPAGVVIPPDRRPHRRTRAAGRLERAERQPHHLALHVAVPRMTDGIAERQVGEYEARHAAMLDDVER